MFHIRNNVPLMEWSIEGVYARSKINFSGRMSAGQTPGNPA